MKGQPLFKGFDELSGHLSLYEDGGWRAALADSPSVLYTVPSNLILLIFSSSETLALETRVESIHEYSWPSKDDWHLGLSVLWAWVQVDSFLSILQQSAMRCCRCWERGTPTNHFRSVWVKKLPDLLRECRSSHGIGVCMLLHWHHAGTVAVALWKS